jgi:hypothetical protein
MLESMGAYLDETLDRNGTLVKAKFYPSADQLRFAMARASIKNNEKSDIELMKELGMSRGKLEHWRQEYGRHFEEWLCKCIENFQAPVKEALFAFGVDRAFQGDFNFWKEVSKTTGAITADKIEISTISRGVEELARLSPEELQLEEERILASLVGTEFRANKEDSVAEAPSGEEPSGSENRAGALQVEP